MDVTLAVGDGRGHATRPAGILAEGKMRSVIMVVVEELSQQPAKMLLVQNDHVIEQLAPASTDPALRDAVLPGAAEAGPNGANFHAPEGSAYLGRKDRVPIHQQVPGQSLISNRTVATVKKSIETRSLT